MKKLSELYKIVLATFTDEPICICYSIVNSTKLSFEEVKILKLDLEKNKPKMFSKFWWNWNYYEGAYWWSINEGDMIQR